MRAAIQATIGGREAARVAPVGDERLAGADRGWTLAAFLRLVFRAEFTGDLGVGGIAGRPESAGAACRGGLEAAWVIGSWLCDAAMWIPVFIRTGGQAASGAALGP